MFNNSVFSFNFLQLHICIVHPMKSLNTFWFECLILLFFITLFYGLWLFLQHFDWLLFTLNLISFLYRFPFLYHFSPFLSIALYLFLPLYQSLYRHGYKMLFISHFEFYKSVKKRFVERMHLKVLFVKPNLCLI